MRVSLPALIFLASMPVLATASVDANRQWPRGKSFVPQALYPPTNKLNKIIVESNPRLYLYPDFDPAADHILVIGMDGWGGRSENFIDTVVLGLKRPELTKRLIVAAIQDPVTRGPLYQGQGDRAHANVWNLDEEAFQVLEHFVSVLSDSFGPMRVYFFGYSSGATAAPMAAVRVGRTSTKFRVEGAISMGASSSVSASTVASLNRRLLFLEVREQRKGDPKASRYDQGNRQAAEKTVARLTAGGATAYLRHIETVSRHVDWHWGLMSQCRYFKSGRADPGRGYYPNYWMPNPETFEHIAQFVQGKEPPAKIENPELQKCPY
jgi:hypothetical protein